MTDTAVMHALYPLAEFSVLAALASAHTTATIGRPRLPAPVQKCVGRH
jgi:hypothetical protein